MSEYIINVPYAEHLRKVQEMNNSLSWTGRVLGKGLLITGAVIGVGIITSWLFESDDEKKRKEEYEKEIIEYINKHPDIKEKIMNN